MIHRYTIETPARRAFRRTRRLIAVLLVACSTGRVAGAQCPDHVLVDRKPIALDGALYLIDVFARPVALRRLRLHVAVPDSQPLVVIDGLISGSGVSGLSMIPVTAVDSVLTLRPIDATWRFGMRGRNGAIVIHSRSGTNAANPGEERRRCTR